LEGFQSASQSRKRYKFMKGVEFIKDVFRPLPLPLARTRSHELLRLTPIFKGSQEFGEMALGLAGL
jgi:hypothetical protein